MCIIMTIKRQISFEEQIIWIIVAGLLWGGLELFLAPLLRNYTRGLSGILMPFISITVILSLKYKMPRPGTIFLSAIIASMIKYFFAGMVLKGTFMAILVEAIIIEGVFFISGLSVYGFIASGILVQLYSAFHPYFTKGLLCQSTHFVFFKKFLAESVHLKFEQTALIVVLIALHMLSGFLSGFIAWRMIWFFKNNKRNLIAADN